MDKEKTDLGLKTEHLFVVLLTISSTHFIIAQRYDNTITTALKLLWLASVLGLIIYTIGARELFVSRSAFMMVGLYIYILFVTLIQRRLSNLGNIPRGLLCIIVMVVLFDRIITERKWGEFRAFLSVLEILTIINFVSILVFKNTEGIKYFDMSLRVVRKGVYFLGYDNGNIITTFPVAVFNAYEYAYSRKKRHLIMIAIGMLSPILCRSTTSIIMYSLWIGFMIAYKIMARFKKILTGSVLWAMIFSGLFYEIVIRNGVIISSLLNTLFNKNISNARSIIYYYALRIIRKKWIFGYGYVPGEKLFMNLASPHNVVLNYLIYGGVVGVAWFFIIILYSIKKLGNSSARSSIILLGAILALVIASYAEGYDSYLNFYQLLIIVLCAMRFNDFDEMYSMSLIKPKERM